MSRALQNLYRRTGLLYQQQSDCRNREPFFRTTPQESTPIQKDIAIMILRKAVAGRQHAGNLRNKHGGHRCEEEKILKVAFVIPLKEITTARARIKQKTPLERGGAYSLPYDKYYDNFIPFCSIFAHASFSVTMRLKTSRSALLSFESAEKYPIRSN